MEDNKGGKTMWIVLGIAILVLIVVFAVKMGRKSADQEVVVNTAPQEALSTEDVSVGSVNSTTGTKPVTLSYAQALVKYKNARIQLDDTCQASPRNVTYKNNTNMMIDNRSAVSRTLKIGGSVSVKAWGFKIVNISSTKLPATWLVDCDGSQNVATILIQK
jgi:hypothetical protein